MIEKDVLPANALLQKYVQSGAYTDCYSTKTSSDVPLATFVTAFYTTWLFKLERFILRVAVSKPSTDDEVHALLNGNGEKFAAWYVEERADDQLLMCDFRDQTRSWFMVAPGRIYFGSAVIPVEKKSFRWLLGLHRLYSRALLAAARYRLQ